MYEQASEEESQDSATAPCDMMVCALLMATGLFIMLAGLLHGLHMLS